MVDDLEPEPMKIESRADFAQWAIERSRAIVTNQGGDLALAAPDSTDDYAEYFFGPGHSIRR